MFRLDYSPTKNRNFSPRPYWFLSSARRVAFLNRTQHTTNHHNKIQRNIMYRGKVSATLPPPQRKPSPYHLIGSTDRWEGAPPALPVVLVIGVVGVRVWDGAMPLTLPSLGDLAFNSTGVWGRGSSLFSTDRASKPRGWSPPSGGGGGPVNPVPPGFFSLPAPPPC